MHLVVQRHAVRVIGGQKAIRVGPLTNGRFAWLGNGMHTAILQPIKTLFLDLTLQARSKSRVMREQFDQIATD
jgi:hypothetical protein